MLCNDQGDGYAGPGEPCDPAETCVGGTCEAQECAPSKPFCLGTVVRVCADDGLSSSEVETCAEGSYCDESSAKCKPGVCAPNQPACDGERATTCNASGSGYAASGETCGATTTCQAGVCKPHVCPAGKLFCQGQDVKSCAANGLSSGVEVTCEHQICVEAGGTVSCAGNCEPGESACNTDKTIVQACDAETGQFKASTPCSNKTCVASGYSAACTGSCAPGQTQCNAEGTGLRSCDGSGEFGAAVPCDSAKPLCADGSCKARPTTCSLTGSPGSGSATLTTATATTTVKRDGWSYIVQNNFFATGQQSLKVDGVSFEVTQQTGNAQPASFPSVFIGSNNGKATVGSNLPKAISALTTVPVAWSYAPAATGRVVPMFEVWFSTSSSGDAGAPSGGRLFIWPEAVPGIQPFGSKQATLVFAGATWDYWVGVAGDAKPAVTFVRSAFSRSLTFDLKPFISHSVSQGHLSSAWHLTNVFAGFEIWSGGVGAKTTNFCAIVN